MRLGWVRVFHPPRHPSVLRDSRGAAEVGPHRSSETEDTGFRDSRPRVSKQSPVPERPEGGLVRLGPKSRVQVRLRCQQQGTGVEVCVVQRGHRC